MVKRIKATLLFFLLSVTVLCACSNTRVPGSAPEGAILVYYPDREKGKLVPAVHVLEAEAADMQVLLEETVTALRTPENGRDLIAAIPEEVALTGYHLEGTLLTLDFDVRYLDMDPATEVLSRAAMVLTFTEIEGVDEVLFLVSGTSLMKDEVTPVGVMRADSFLLTDLP